MRDNLPLIQLERRVLGRYWRALPWRTRVRLYRLSGAGWIGAIVRAVF